jgi:hypothetical protein
MKIVETNAIYEGLKFHDHQSRVLEISSWEEYCNLYRNYNGEVVRDEDFKYEDVYDTLLGGCLLPKGATIISLKIDEHHLTCDMILNNGMPHYKFAYVLDKHHES